MRSSERRPKRPSRRAKHPVVETIMPDIITNDSSYWFEAQNPEATVQITVSKVYNSKLDRIVIATNGQVDSSQT